MVNIIKVAMLTPSIPTCITIVLTAVLCNNDGYMYTELKIYSCYSILTAIAITVVLTPRTISVLLTLNTIYTNYLDMSI
jgi:hypothetical protein